MKRVRVGRCLHEFLWTFGTDFCFAFFETLAAAPQSLSGRTVKHRKKPHNQRIWVREFLCLRPRLGLGICKPFLISNDFSHLSYLHNHSKGFKTEIRKFRFLYHRDFTELQDTKIYSTSSFTTIPKAIRNLFQHTLFTHKIPPEEGFFATKHTICSTTTTGVAWCFVVSPRFEPTKASAAPKVERNRSRKPAGLLEIQDPKT